MRGLGFQLAVIYATRNIAQLEDRDSRDRGASVLLRYAVPSGIQVETGTSRHHRLKRLWGHVCGNECLSMWIYERALKTRDD